MNPSANQLRHETVLDDSDDLYRKYCQFTEGARRQVLMDYPPGPDREHWLKRWEPVHKERFEAKLVEFGKTPGQLERIFYLLDRGFKASP